MKKKLAFTLLAAALSSYAVGQEIKAASVPAVVIEALAKKYPEATKVSWEKENGNYEANWGGKSGEDTAVQFTPAGIFVLIEKAMPVSGLPAGVVNYIKTNKGGAKITEAGKITNAAGKTMYEAEVKGKDMLFDEDGKFIKMD